MAQINLSAMENHKRFPYDIRELEPSINAELLQYFKGERTGFVQVGPEGFFFPHKYKLEAESYYNFEARADDIWITTVPRSGTTWTQELIWLLANNLDFEKAQSRPLTERFPFLEFPLFVHDAVKAELMEQNKNDSQSLAFLEHVSRPGYETLNELPTNQRRFIKTHFPFSLMPPSILEKKCKIIYVSRNPKDVAVSYYHLNRLFCTQGYVGDFERYWRYFQQGLNPWLPYHSHVKEAKQHANLPNVLFLRYENMLVDLAGTIQKIASFLNCPLNPVDLDKLLDHLSIHNFRENKSVNMHEMAAVGITKPGEAGFVRTGGSDAKGPQEFQDNPKLLSSIDEWIEKNSDTIKTI